jgi:hypothetical protein
MQEASTNEFNLFENKVVNVCAHLTNELIDFGLINPRDYNIIFDLLLKSIKDYYVTTTALSYSKSI